MVVQIPEGLYNRTPPQTPHSPTNSSEEPSVCGGRLGRRVVVGFNSWKTNCIAHCGHRTENRSAPPCTPKAALDRTRSSIFLARPWWRIMVAAIGLMRCYLMPRASQEVSFTKIVFGESTTSRHAAKHPPGKLSTHLVMLVHRVSQQRNRLFPPNLSLVTRAQRRMLSVGRTSQERRR